MRDVIEHEAFALIGDRNTDRARDRTIAPQNLRAAVVDVEGVDAKGCDGEVACFAAPRRARDHNHARSRH